MESNNKRDLPLLFRYRIVWHILFWVAICFSYIISYGGYNNNFIHEIKVTAALLPIRITFTYIMLYALLPYLMNQRYKAFFILTFVHALLFGFALWIVYREFMIFIGHSEMKTYPIFRLGKIFVSIISNYAIPLSAAVFKLFKWWYIDQQYKVQIEKEKLESELKYLKAQINPHFLFNTINNLYALTLQNSSKASDVVLKLSGLLDYMLYHSKSERVSLNKELDIISSYIELEKIRYGDRLNLSYKINGDTTSIQIAPLILIPFVENAFKHGASNDRANPVIKIDVNVDKECLQLTVENSLPKHKQIENNNGSGIGLSNIRRQLDLIYPNSHLLDIKVEETSYKIYLEINCNN